MGQGIAIKPSRFEDLIDIRKLIEKQVIYERGFDLNTTPLEINLTWELLLEYPFNFCYWHENQLVGYLRLAPEENILVGTHLCSVGSSSLMVGSKLVNYAMGFLTRSTYLELNGSFHKNNIVVKLIYERNLKKFGKDPKTCIQIDEDNPNYLKARFLND